MATGEQGVGGAFHSAPSTDKARWVIQGMGWATTTRRDMAHARKNASCGALALAN